ncbi:MAG: hypothetical protein ACKOKE_04950, partial [Actinomycetota bacterium]
PAVLQRVADPHVHDHLHDASNVQIVCRACGKPTRGGHVVRADGSKARVCRKCEGEL